VHDSVTGKQESLGTNNRTEALRFLHAKNEAVHQPLINVQIARAYLAATDTAITRRNWHSAMDEVVKAKRCSSPRQRHERAFEDKAFNSLRTLPILQTRPEHFRLIREVCV
jgi:hypothetical protein